MRASEIERVDVSMYRKSEYSDYETAFKNGGVRDMTETYGYSATLDSLSNCSTVALLLGECDDIWIRMIVDGVALSECTLHHAQFVMHKELGIDSIFE